MKERRPITPRMNLFRGLERETKPKLSLDPKGLSVHAIAALAVLLVAAVSLLQAQLAHSRRVRELEGQIASLENQLRTVVAQTEERARLARKPAGKSSRPSGIDGSWAAVLWKFAAFTGSRVQISNMTLQPQGGRVQLVNLNGQAASYDEVRMWIERLIANMPGSEFNVSSQRLGEDPHFPVLFAMSAQVL